MANSKIIAEVGVNHNGNFDLALKLIEAAKDAGADYVKFQTYKTEKIVTKDAPKASYQRKEGLDHETHYEMLRKLELSFEEFEKIKKYCDYKKIGFLSSPFDIDSANFLLKHLQLELIKIGSGEITNAPLLSCISKFKPKMILSTGMSDLEDICRALNFLHLAQSNRENEYSPNQSHELPKRLDSFILKNVCLLHCTSSYPANFEDLNLNALKTLKKKFGLKVGYSDHSLGIEVPIAAVTMGANLIEKHLTLNCALPGPDHTASLEPTEFKRMVMSIRNIEKSFGTHIKHKTKDELEVSVVARKGLYVSRNLPKDHVITEDDILVLRPAAELSPLYFWEIIGKNTTKELFKGTPFSLNDLI